MKFHAGLEIWEKSLYWSEQRLIPSNLETPSLTGQEEFSPDIPAPSSRHMDLSLVDR